MGHKAFFVSFAFVSNDYEEFLQGDEKTTEFMTTKISRIQNPEYRNKNAAA